MRLIVAVSVSLLGLAAHTQPSTLDPATQARLRMDGFAGGTGARIPPEANGGATVGEGQPNRHRVTKPVDLNPAPPEAAQVGCDAPESRAVERGKLVPPGIGEIGKAVQQDYRSACSALHVSDANAIGNYEMASGHISSADGPYKPGTGAPRRRM